MAFLNLKRPMMPSVSIMCYFDDRSKLNKYIKLANIRKRWGMFFIRGELSSVKKAS